MITSMADACAEPPPKVGSLMQRGLWNIDPGGPRVATREEFLATIAQAPRLVKRRHRRGITKAHAAAEKAEQRTEAFKNAFRNWKRKRR